MRLAQSVDGVAVEIGNGRAMQLVRRATVEFHVARQCHGVGAGLLQGLANIHRFQPRQRVDVLQDQCADLGQDAPPLRRGHARPWAVQRGAGGGHGAVDIGVAAAGDLADGCACRWVFQI